MISSEVERTLVKSPPELWAELSDPTALSRHLGELGEIRIVRTEPESTVEWTAENTTGTVSIKPSGWGTKVKLSVTRELDEPTTTSEAASDVAPAAEAELAQEPEPALEPEATLEPGPAPEPRAMLEAGDAHEPEAAPGAEPEDAVEPAATQKPETTPEQQATQEPETTKASDPAKPEARRGFFARLFGRRARTAQATSSDEATSTKASPPETTATPEPPAPPEIPVERQCGSGDAFAAVREALAPETFAAVHLFETQSSPGMHRARAMQPAPEAPPADESPPADATHAAPHEGRVVDISAELMAVEEAASAEVTAVLTAVLDSLGAAHHRPFSRA